MKRTFGSWTTRLLRGGIRLTDGEFHLLSALVAELPPFLRSTVEAQFDLYDLAQREVDMRTLNFYPARAGHRCALPLLKSKLEVAPLVRISSKVVGVDEPIHAVLTAANGRAFSVSFSRQLPKISAPSDYSIVKVTQAWSSNFETGSNAA